jgi:aryl carrier-like protein
VIDRYEKTPLSPGVSTQADKDRDLLQKGLDSMPLKAAKLSLGKKK